MKTLDAGISAWDIADLYDAAIRSLKQSSVQRDGYVTSMNSVIKTRMRRTTGTVWLKSQPGEGRSTEDLVDHSSNHFIRSGFGSSVYNSCE
ncbi:hypothetical protein LY78DRAFT_280193 [Colletotrichum sublineola]|nr:hypothetical protein LY78DRAFT_280193 [Colletotrichum sublineola]